MDADKLWTAYKYKTIYDQNLVDSFNYTYELQFPEYILDRFTAKNWLLDIYGDLITNYNMKSPNAYCPWKTTAFRRTSDGITDIQKELNCTCPVVSACNRILYFSGKQ